MKKRKKKKKNSKQFNRQFKKTFFTKKSAIIIVCTVIILSAFWGAYQKVERKAAKYQKTIDELKTEDVKKLMPADYKNYIAMQILQEAYELIAEAGIYYDTYLHNIGLYNLSPMVVDCGDGT